MINIIEIVRNSLIILSFLTIQYDQRQRIVSWGQGKMENFISNLLWCH